VHHPRRCGLATHLGVTLDIPTIGCSKKMLQVDGICREKVEEAFLRDAAASASASAGGVTTLPYVLPLVGATSPAQLYGYAVHGHLNSVKKCIFVSPGHCVGFAVATALVVTMLKHRIPEPIRAADLGSRALIRDSLASAAATASGEDA
jgi:endonuclease V